MQKFSEFVKDYEQWKLANKQTSEVTSDEVKKIRELYESLNSKKSKMEESEEKEPEEKEEATDACGCPDCKDGKCDCDEKEKVEESTDYEKALASYREWKFEKKGTRGVTLKEKELIRSKLNVTKLNESSEKCECCGLNVEETSKVEDYINIDDPRYDNLDPQKIIDALNEDGYVNDLTTDSKLCSDCIENGIDKVLDKAEMDKEPTEEDLEGEENMEFEFEESIEGFKSVVAKYREWKKDKYGTEKLTENEKEVLKAKFLEKVEESKKETSKDARLVEAIAQYKEWKKAEHGSDEITQYEEATIAKNLVLDDIKAKLDEAKKFVESGKKHLTEGDVMDAGADANAAAGAVADASAMGADPTMGGDPNAMAADPNAAGAALPQNIVDEISQIKTSIDSLATECGIESPVDLGADPNAGVPAVTGAADPNVDANAAPADPNAAPAPDAGAAQMPESIKSVKARIAARNQALKETAKFSNTAMKDGAKEDMVKIPSEQELVNGTKSGIAKAAAWPVTKVEPKDSKKLKNIEESQEELAKQTLDESGEFSWAAYTNMLKNMR